MEEPSITSFSYTSSAWSVQHTLPRLPFQRRIWLAAWVGMWFGPLFMIVAPKSWRAIRFGVHTGSGYNGADPKSFRWFVVDKETP